jgi:hypothetical protein
MHPSDAEIEAVAPLPETQRPLGPASESSGLQDASRGCSGRRGMHPSITEIEAVAMLQWTQCLPPRRVSESISLQEAMLRMSWPLGHASECRVSQRLKLLPCCWRRRGSWGLRPSQAGCKMRCRGCSGRSVMYPSIAEIEAVAMLPWTRCPPGRVSESRGSQGAMLRM